MRFEPLRKLLLLLIGLGWVATCVAAKTAPETLSGLPWAQVGIGGALALWGGLTRTAERALDAIKTAQRFPLLPELAKDLFVSSGAGFLVYMLGAVQDWNVWALGGALWVAGYLGTRFLTRYATTWLDKQAPPTTQQPDDGAQKP